MENTINILKKIWMVITVVLRALKSKLGLIILAVLVVVGGFTFVSYRNYIKDLPMVTLTSSVGNSMRTQMQTTGALYYNEVLDVRLPQGCRVENVFVSQGDAVEEGSSLLCIKVADLQLARLNKQLQIEALQEVEEKGGTEGELAYWEKELLLEEVADLEKLIAAEGIVKVDSLPTFEGDGSTEEEVTEKPSTKTETKTESNETADGEEVEVNPVRVIAQTYKKGDLTNMDVPITLGLPEGGCYLEWQISASDYKEYKGTASIKGQQEDLSWEAPKLANGIYTYRSMVATPDNFVQGEPVKIVLNYVSEAHNAVLPRSCIRTDIDGSNYVYEVHTRDTTYGEEQYVRKQGVTIVEYDSLNVAVKGSVYNVVQGSSKQLEDLMPVIIIEN